MQLLARAATDREHNARIEQFEAAVDADTRLTPEQSGVLWQAGLGVLDTGSFPDFDELEAMTGYDRQQLWRLVDELIAAGWVLPLPTEDRVEYRVVRP
ncbi:hypothetical protein FOS14_00800 [Skermania sp. ID1734]|uniref:hypothetical protein n=1 Tax=Skermania sp. ID1734 TaxID=2597516 RepID=UPI00117C1562|nr:hypothetical protein [Skermania sp. ID1734]TSE01965.1 hypothetical protein FOS14_00800 [Skermania sp. ID1734]